MILHHSLLTLEHPFYELRKVCSSTSTVGILGASGTTGKFKKRSHVSCALLQSALTSFFSMSLNDQPATMDSLLCTTTARERLTIGYGYGVYAGEPKQNYDQTINPD